MAAARGVHAPAASCCAHRVGAGVAGEASGEHGVEVAWRGERPSRGERASCTPRGDLAGERFILNESERIMRDMIGPFLPPCARRALPAG